MSVSPQQSAAAAAAHPPVLALPLPVEIEDALADARRAWFRQFSAKQVARTIGCKVETAERYRTGAMPNGPQLAAMISHWGPDFLAAIFGPVLNPAGETVDQRLARIERDAAAVRRDLELEKGAWRHERADGGAAGARQAGAERGSAGLGGSAPPLGAADAPPLRASLRGAFGRGTLILAGLCLSAGTLIAAFAGDADALDMRRPPGGVRARPPASVLRSVRGGPAGRAGSQGPGLRLAARDGAPVLTLSDIGLPKFGGAA